MRTLLRGSGEALVSGGRSGPSPKTRKEGGSDDLVNSPRGLCDRLTAASAGRLGPAMTDCRDRCCRIHGEFDPEYDDIDGAGWIVSDEYWADCPLVAESER